MHRGDGDRGQGSADRVGSVERPEPEWTLLAARSQPVQYQRNIPPPSFGICDTTAAMMGMNVPEIQLVDLDSGSGLPQRIGELQGFRNERGMLLGRA